VHTRKDISEKTVGAQQFSLDCPFPLCLYSFLWFVRPCVPLLFSLDCPPLCASTIFSGLSSLVCPYRFLWVVCPCDNPEKTIRAHTNGHLRENRRSTQEWTTNRKSYGHTRKDNPEKTVGANKDGQSRENSTATQGQTTQRKR
jgi:hypothetical protein